MAEERPREFPRRWLTLQEWLLRFGAILAIALALMDANSPAPQARAYARLAPTFQALLGTSLLMQSFNWRYLAFFATVLTLLAAVVALLSRLGQL